MIHTSYLSQAQQPLPCDLRGFIPESGDEPGSFSWPAGTEWTPASWATFVAQAHEAIERVPNINAVRVFLTTGKWKVQQLTTDAEWEKALEKNRAFIGGNGVKPKKPNYATCPDCQQIMDFLGAWGGGGGCVRSLHACLPCRAFWTIR